MLIQPSLLICKHCIKIC